MTGPGLDRLNTALIVAIVLLLVVIALGDLRDLHPA
jgi:hypothetical protein